MGSGSSDKPAAGSRYAWYVVGMLWCISFFNYADRQAIFSVFPLLETEMDLSNTDKGLLGSSFALVYALSSPFAGVLVDRMRRKTAILGGLHAWSVICLATALSRRFTHLIFFRAAEGLGETFYYPASVSMISDYHGQATRSRALGLHQTSVYVGTVAGGTFAGLIGQHFGWQSSFVVFGSLGIVLGVLLHRVLREPQRGAAETNETSGAKDSLSIEATLRLIFSTPTVLALLLAFFSANFVAMVLIAWMPNFLFKEFDLSLAAAGLVGTIFPQGASLIGALVGGWLADAWRRRAVGGRSQVQSLGVLLAAPFVVLAGRADTVYSFALIVTAWGLFKGIYDANIFAAAFDVIPPEARGSVVGVMNLVGWLGAAASATTIGYLADLYGLRWAISASAVGYLIACGLLLLAGFGFVKRDAARVKRMIQAETTGH